MVRRRSPARLAEFAPAAREMGGRRARGGGAFRSAPDQCFGTRRDLPARCPSGRRSGGTPAPVRRYRSGRWGRRGVGCCGRAACRGAGDRQPGVAVCCRSLRPGSAGTAPPGTEPDPGRGWVADRGPATGDDRRRCPRRGVVSGQEPRVAGGRGGRVAGGTGPRRPGSSRPSGRRATACCADPGAAARFCAYRRQARGG